MEMMMTGMIIGARIKLLASDFPQNRLRTSEMAARVPRTLLSSIVNMAICRLM